VRTPDEPCGTAPGPRLRSVAGTAVAPPAGTETDSAVPVPTPPPPPPLVAAAAGGGGRGGGGVATGGDGTVDVDAAAPNSRERTRSDRRSGLGFDGTALPACTVGAGAAEVVADAATGEAALSPACMDVGVDMGIGTAIATGWLWLVATVVRVVPLGSAVWWLIPCSDNASVKLGLDRRCGRRGDWGGCCGGWWARWCWWGCCGGGLSCWGCWGCRCGGCSSPWGMWGAFSCVNAPLSCVVVWVFCVAAATATAGAASTAAARPSAPGASCHRPSGRAAAAAASLASCERDVASSMVAERGWGVAAGRTTDGAPSSENCPERGLPPLAKGLPSKLKPPSDEPRVMVVPEGEDSGCPESLSPTGDTTTDSRSIATTMLDGVAAKDRAATPPALTLALG